MDRHVTVLGVIFIASGVLGLLVAALVQFYDRNTKTFLEYLGRIGRARPRHPPAHVVMVGDQNHKAEKVALHEYRLEHEDIR